MVQYTADDFVMIHGAGGGKGKKQRAPVEAPNTLQSRQTVRVQEVLSEGPIKGVVGGLKGIMLDDTVIQNADNTYNFPAVGYDFRYGTPTQDYMAGFPSVESATVVNVEIESPIIRTVSSADIDAVRIGIRIPQIYSIDTASGDRNGHRIGIAIDVRAAGGNWATAIQKTITGKAIHAYEESFRVERPPTSGVFDVRVRRTTTKSDSDTKQDAVTWFTMTEIQDIKVSYPNASVVGLAIDSEATGGKIPKRSYLTDGLIIKVPTNYQPTVYNADGTVLSYASYTSPVWNGQFKNEWTDDPAWILYDLMTNTRYGIGKYIEPGTINIYDFYEASKYNCELILKGDGSQNLEPRFTFNGPLAARENAYMVLQTLAASFRSVIFSAPGYIRLIQDRPQSPSAKINNSNVVNGEFTYSGTELENRTTAVVVNYNDKTNGYNPRTVKEEASDQMIQRFGYNQVEISPIGVTGEGQARRLAKWMIDTATGSIDTATFRVSWNNAFMEVGDVIEIADEDYANSAFSGLLKAIPGGNVNQIRFDQQLSLTVGTQIKFINFVGEEQTRTIAVTGNNTDTFTLNALPGALNPNEFPGVPYVVMGSIAPRQFKVVAVSESEVGQYDITASFYDGSKYARVEQGIYVLPPLYSNIGGWTIAAPTNIGVETEPYLNNSGVIRYKLHFNWDEVNDEHLKYYMIQYRRNNGAFEWTDMILHSEFTLDDCLPGIYEYNIFAYNTRAIQSPAASGWYELATTSVEPSPLVAVTDVRLVDGGTTFNSNQFTIRWNHSESVVNATRLDYQINIHNGTNLSAPIVHTLYQTDNLLTITRDNIISWMGGPERNIFISVRPRDTMERLGQPAGALFNNPAPAIPSNIQAFAFFTSYQVDHSQVAGPDIAGYVVHHSTSSNFVPSTTNLVASGVGTSHLVPAEAETTYYVRVAAYDTWSQQGLNYAPELSVTTTSLIVGITPTPPTNLAVTSVIATTSPGTEQARITVTWNKSTNTDMYDLEILAPSIGVADYPVVTQPEAGNVVTYTFYGVPAAVYNFKIRSRAATNVSEWSSTVTHTAAADTTPPALPTGLVVTSGFGSAAVKWVNPTASDLAFVQVWRRKTSAPTQAESLVVSVPAPIDSYFDSGLEIGGTYQYRVRAVDRSGNASGYTALASVVVGGLPNGSVNSGALLDDAVTAAKLATNSVTADAILAGTIVASKMAIGDWSNIVPDPEMLDDASWQLPANFAFVQHTNSNLNMRSQRVILYTKPAGATGYTAPIRSKTFSVEPGAQYYVSLQTSSTTNASHNVLYRVFWKDSSGGNKGYTDVRINEPSNYAMQSTGAQVTAPTGAVIGFLAAYVQQSATAASGIYIGGPVVRRAQTGELIVDGAITTDKLFANAVTAAKIAANTITANEINAGSIRAAVLVANSISTAMIQAGAVNADKIEANSIRAAVLTANSITSTMIAANQITATHVGANTIITNSANIADAVIISAKIQNGAIENAKIANGAVTNLKISGLLSSNNYIYNQQGWGFSKDDGSLSINGNVPGQGRSTLDFNGLTVFDAGGNVRLKLTVN